MNIVHPETKPQGGLTKRVGFAFGDLCTSPYKVYGDYVYEDGTTWLICKMWHSAISGNVLDPFGFAQGRLYEDGTDWLLRETWRSAISGNVFDLVRYWYTNGRPSRAEIAQGPSDMSAVWSYDQRYLQANWHGDIVRRVWLNGDGGTEMAYDPWGNSVRGLHYYEWNGAWGYMAFGALQLYYVHGRWYNPDTGLFLSPDANGEYRYGSGQDAVNWAWQPRRKLGTSGLARPSFQSQDGKFACVEGYGCFDTLHLRNFGYPGGQAAYWEDFRLQSRLGRNFDIQLNNPTALGSSLEIVYWVNGAIQTWQYEGVAMAIFQDFAREFEAFQMVNSNFANADLPSDYLGLVAAIRGISPPDRILNELGKVTYTNREYPPATFFPNEASNYEFTPRVNQGG